MKFVVIASPRTGSTHLRVLLNRQQDVICNGEVFRVRHDKVPLRAWRKKDRPPEPVAELIKLRDQNPKAFLDRIFEQNYGCGNVGFKIFSGHNDEILHLLIHDPSIRKVVLFRRNVLAVYSSAQIAHRKGERVLRTPRQDQEKVEFERDKFIDFCEQYLGFYRTVLEQLARDRQTWQIVHYEQINDRWLFSNLLSFIGAEPVIPEELVGRSVKQNSSDILSRFSNPEEVLAYLQEFGLIAWRHESEICFRSPASPA